MDVDRSIRWVSSAGARIAILSLLALVFLFCCTTRAHAQSAGGSTNLTISIDQSFVDRVIAWRIAHGLPPTVSGEQPDERLARQIDGWLNGLLALQMPDGGFEAKPGSGTQSPYSNGEIWLVLAHYVERYPDHVAARAALQRADRRFIEFYGANPDIGFFHWGVMAASKRYLATGDERFARFAAAQIDDYIHRMRPEVKEHANSCYAVEGMLAGVAALSRHGGYARLERALRERSRAEMEKNRRLQILPGQRRIQFGPQRYLQAPEIADHAGAFLNGLYRPQVRVDATQHCLSAMLKEAEAETTTARR